MIPKEKHYDNVDHRTEHKHSQYAKRCLAIQFCSKYTVSLNSITIFHEKQTE